MPHPTLIGSILDLEIDVAVERLAHRGVRLDRDGTRVYLWLPELNNGTRIALDGPNYDAEPLGLSVVDLTGTPVTQERWPIGLVHSIHPTIGQPFACLQGLNEYFEHPGHRNESWDQHRGRIRLVDLISHILSRVSG